MQLAHCGYHRFVCICKQLCSRRVERAPTNCKLLLTGEHNNGRHAGSGRPDPRALQLMGTDQSNSCYACWGFVGSKGLPSNDNQPLVCQVCHGNGIAVGQLVPEGKFNTLSSSLS